MKKIVASAMAATMAVSLAACGGTSTSTATSTAESKTESTAASSEAAAEETAGNLSGTLEVWSSGEELGRFVEGFNKEYPDVTVNITVVPNADFLTKLTPTLASGQGAPDIFTGESDYVKYLVNSGYWDAVFYRCDNPEFEEFVTSFGFETAGGSCSDISYIAPYLETAAVNISCGYYCEHQRHEYIRLEEMELNAARVAQMVMQQTEHFEYREQRDSFFGGRAYQYSMWDTAFERETYKWLSPLPKEAKIKLGTVELIMPHAKIDRQGNVHRYVPKLKAAVLTENAIAVMPDGKKARYDSPKAKCQKVMPLSRALEILNTI